MAKGLSKMERLAHSVEAGVYMTFGAFIEDFDTLTKALETALRIELLMMTIICTKIMNYL